MRIFPSMAAISTGSPIGPCGRCGSNGVKTTWPEDWVAAIHRAAQTVMVLVIRCEPANLQRLWRANRAFLSKPFKRRPPEAISHLAVSTSAGCMTPIRVLHTELHGSVYADPLRRLIRRALGCHPTR